MRKQSPTAVVLRSARAQAVVVPGAGGRLGSLQIDGEEILVTSGARRLGYDWEWGCFPLAPWAGIQRGASFTFGSRRYALPTDDRGEAWHGLVAERPWKVRRAGYSEALLDIAIGGRSAVPWFTPATVRQCFTLRDQSLTIRLEVESPWGEMPVVLGLHPWFRRNLGEGRPASVDFQPAARLVGEPGARVPTVLKTLLV